MSGLLERLRAANPVPDCGAPPIKDLWRKLDQELAASADRLSPAEGGPTPRRERRGRAVRIRLAILLGLLGAVAVVAALASRGAAPSIAARAYAATASDVNVIHYVEIDHVMPVSAGTVATGSRADVWISGSRSHRVRTSYLSERGQHTVLRDESAVDGALFQGYQSNTIFEGRMPIPGSIRASCGAVTSCGFDPTDPVTTVRELYNAGQLHDAGQTLLNGRRVDVITSKRPATAGPAKVRILIDPQTFIPVEIVETYDSPPGQRFLTATTTIKNYQRLPLTQQTSKLLAMRPHPHAHVICAPGAAMSRKGPVRPPKCPPSSG